MSQRLQIINACMRVIGEDMRDTELEDHPDVANASEILDDVRAEHLADGYYYNTVEMTLQPNSSNEIDVDESVLAVYAKDNSKRITIRGSRLYDNEKNTYKFTSGIDVTVIRDLPEDEIPPIPRAFIKWATVLEFAAFSQVSGTALDMAQRKYVEADEKLAAEQYRKFTEQGGRFNETPMHQRMFSFYNKYTRTPKSRGRLK